ncbi:hypothetical protein [Ensifer aridi]|uniref:hypothetical protein n=1 Tax=Ensifer aridi TaxID=1708715 RepID=UPI000A11B854|nr:hypothetical protein [Ensifer aridi]
MTDIDLTEAQIRRMEKKLLAGGARRCTVVETCRSGRKPVERTPIRVIQVFDKDAGSRAEPYMWIFEQRMSKAWVEFERIHSKAAATRAARKYGEDGAAVEWWERRA